MRKGPTIPLRAGRFLAVLRDRVNGYSTTSIFAVSFLLIAAITALNFLTTPKISLYILFLAPICIAVWRLGRPAGLFLSLVCALMSLAVDIRSADYASPVVPVWDALIRLGFFAIITYILSLLTIAMDWARTDYLTGVANERGFGELAERELHRSFRTGRTLTLAYLDIDNFRFVNERFGRASGDSVLELTAGTLATATRKGDIVCRIEGDAFLILFPETDFFGAAIAVQNVRNALVQSLAEKSWKLTFCIGVATFQSPPESIGAAIIQAKELLHSGKSGGKNTTVHRQVGSAQSGDGGSRRGLRAINARKP